MVSILISKYHLLSTYKLPWRDITYDLLSVKTMALINSLITDTIKPFV